MSKINHSRGFKCQKDAQRYHNGRGKRCWKSKSEFADVTIAAGIGHEFSQGHRGEARAKRGAKKYVRTRIRFQEKQKLNKIIRV